MKWVKVYLSKAGPVVLALEGCFVLFPSKSTNFPKDSKPWNFKNLRMYLKNSKLIRLFISWNDKMRTENKIEINTVIPVLPKYNYFRMAYSCMPWNDTQWQDIQKKQALKGSSLTQNLQSLGGGDWRNSDQSNSASLLWLISICTVSVMFHQPKGEIKPSLKVAVRTWKLAVGRVVSFFGRPMLVLGSVDTSYL